MRTFDAKKGRRYVYMEIYLHTFPNLAACTNSDMILDSNNECNCPVDTYQETLQDNTIQCTACPEGSSTGSTSGAQSINECGMST